MLAELIKKCRNSVQYKFDVSASEKENPDSVFPKSLLP